MYDLNRKPAAAERETLLLLLHNDASQYRRINRDIEDMALSSGSVSHAARHQTLETSLQRRDAYCTCRECKNSSPDLLGLSTKEVPTRVLLPLPSALRSPTMRIPALLNKVVRVHPSHAFLSCAGVYQHL